MKLAPTPTPASDRASDSCSRGPARPTSAKTTTRAAGQRFASTRPVVLHVVIRPKTDPILDEQGGRIGNFELKPIVSDTSGREVAEFGTVRPRVQIPGPRPVLTSNGRFLGSSGLPDHGRVTPLSGSHPKWGRDVDADGMIATFEVTSTRRGFISLPAPFDEGKTPCSSSLTLKRT